jgi:hypothetical protein
MRRPRATGCGNASAAAGKCRRLPGHLLQTATARYDGQSRRALKSGAIIRADMGRILIIASLLGLLAIALWFAYEQWASVSVEIPLWGWVAILAGGGLSLVVGVGLMALMYYSHRHGYDDRVQEIDRDEP